MSTPITEFPWFKVSVIRCKITIEHETPFQRKFIEEIQVINNGDEDVPDFPIPLTEFKHGLEVLDFDNTILSFYSTNQMDEKINGLDGNLHEPLLHFINNNHLIWVKFSPCKSIHPKELRSIRLTYFGPEDSKPIKPSLFDIPLFYETIGKSPIIPYETFYFIKAPKDFEIKIDKKKTKGIDEHTKLEFKPEYLEKPIETKDFKNEEPNIKNRSNYISARFPAKPNPYKFLLYYTIQLSFLERFIWRIVLPGSAIMLFILLPLPIDNFPIIKLESTALFTIGGSVITISAALIALVSNPLIRRTRALLFIHILLSILLIGSTGITHNP